MGLIKKATELEMPTTIKMMVYGQAGMGKTTFALSAEKPLLLDFDNGVKRVNVDHLKGVDVVQVKNWGEIVELLGSNATKELQDYTTIVVDTVGKMMDYIITYVCADKIPQVRDWNRVNQQFGWFTRRLSEINKHIVFVAHRDTRKEGEQTVFVPALREKSYNAIVTELDLLGYLEMRTVNGRQKRIITFDPSDRNDGKNTCNLKKDIEIPTKVDANGNAIGKNDFISEEIIKPYFGMLQHKQELKAKYDAVVAEIQDAVDFVCDAETANQFVASIYNYNHVGSSLEVARKLLREKVQSLGLVYNKENKSYEDAA